MKESDVLVGWQYQGCFGVVILIMNRSCNA